MLARPPLLMPGDPVAPPALTRAEARASRDAAVAHTLRPLLLASVVLLLVTMASAPFTLARSALAPVLFTEAILIVAFVLAHVALKPERDGVRHVHLILALLVAGAVATTLTTMAATGNLLLTTGIVVVMLGAGIIALSWPWLVALLAVSAGAWAGVMWGLGLPMGWDELSFSVLAAVMLSLMAHHGRMTMHMRHESLRRQETRQAAQLRTVIASAPVVLLATDREGRVTLAEGKGLGDRGWDGSKVVGVRAAEFLLDTPGEAHGLQRALEGATTAGRTEREGHVYETFWTPVQGEGGAIEGAICVATDVTERVRAEGEAHKVAERESAIARLEEMDRFKTRLLNTASHELNTPLTPIKLQMHLLKKEAERLDARQQKAVAVIDRNFERLSALVSDILDVARLQGKNMRVTLTSMDLAATVAEACHSYEGVAAEKGLRLTLEAPAPLVLTADPRRVLQVLFNLLSNAIKFTPAGGEVSVSAAAEGGMAIVRVRDSGAGLTAEQRSRLFAPFSQVHDAVQHDVGGTGLGLYISRGIAEQLGGTLTCASEGAGKGATFTLTLPLR